eukprot:gene26610-32426_t
MAWPPPLLLAAAAVPTGAKVAAVGGTPVCSLSEFGALGRGLVRGRVRVTLSLEGGEALQRRLQRMAEDAAAAPAP